MGELTRIFSPLLFFAAHVVYLALWSPDPFLKKWIDGSFTFFLALVLCNVIRTRIAAAHEAREAAPAFTDEPDRPAVTPADARQESDRDGGGAG